MQICKKCVLDANIPEIEFSQEGVCNYCELHDNLSNAFPNDETGKASITKIFEDIKKKGRRQKYDCLVGISGGVDSVYLLGLVKSHGLNPLAVHIDNGWNSKISDKNIVNIIKILKVDSVKYVIDKSEMNDVLRSFMSASYAWADGPTDIALLSVLYKTAKDYGIKRILVGNNFRTEGRQPTEWTHIDGKILDFIHKKYGSIKELKSFKNLSLWDLFKYEFLYGIKIIKPLYYIDYDKAKAKKEIEKKYNWKDYGGHHHESVFTRFIIGCWLPKKCNIDKRKITFSAQVRSGFRDRKGALEELKELPYSEKLMEEDKQEIIRRLDFTEEEFENIMEKPYTTYKDFPSYNGIYTLVDRYMKFVYNLFGIKPMMAFKLPKYSSVGEVQFDRYRLKKIASLVQGREKILDVGSAAFPNIFLKNKTIIGLDLNTTKGASHYKKIVIGNVDDLPYPFKENEFDAVTAGEIIEHLENPNLFLKGAYNILKAGGTLVLSTPNPNSIWERILTLNLSRKYFYDPEHFNLYPQRWLIRILERNGFKNIKVYSGGLTVPFFNKNIYFPRPWAEYTVISAEK
ncbi:MAG TPA: N-acetyl sugar amidotransferase [Candidatus Dojkabacteria bacterium]|nr:N-acetyl sugar amidotransferase [Methanofastidiosum sp.]HRZ84722.1 N-acetyl sugar amidotransferase [Candidatus Dojkabacteria bacterium]